MDDSIRHMLTLSALFAAHKGLSQTTVSRFSTGSGATLDRLRDGRGITTRRAAAAIQWLSDHWPADLAWPADVPRPAPRATEDAA